jgi:hypothetical protein
MKPLDNDSQVISPKIDKESYNSLSKEESNPRNFIDMIRSNQKMMSIGSNIKFNGEYLRTAPVIQII